jgi:excisionase family DNA binding protein
MSDRAPKRRYKTPPPAALRRDTKEAATMLTVEEAADRLGASLWTVRRWLQQGRIRGVMPGGRRLGWRIPASEIDQLLTPRRRGEDDGAPDGR